MNVSAGLGTTVIPPLTFSPLLIQTSARVAASGPTLSFYKPAFLDHFGGRKSEDFAENPLPPVFKCSRVHDVGRTLVVFPNKSEAFKLTMNAGYSYLQYCCDFHTLNFMREVS
jgi:hypothetical protein